MKNQFRLLWTGISGSKKIKMVAGDRPFRIACHLVYTWLIPWCDDDGRMIGEPLSILANVVPNEGFEIGEIEKMLAELNRVDLIKWYPVDGERFIQIVGWEEHQRIRKDRYKSSRYPRWQPNCSQKATSCRQDANLSPSSAPSSIPTRTEKTIAPTNRKRSDRTRPPSTREEYFTWFDGQVDRFLGEHRETLKKAYPAVDLDAQAAKMKGWIRGNYLKRKSNIGGFMTRWFAKEQDGLRPYQEQPQQLKRERLNIGPSPPLAKPEPLNIIPPELQAGNCA
jgi:hypothetical protein